MAIKKLNNYEMMIALKPLLPDDLRKQMHKDFVDGVKEAGGEVLDVDVWGKRYLAYPIKGHNEAYYIVYDFTIYPEEIAEIKRQMQLKQEVLRFMIVSIDDTSKIGKSLKKKEIEI
ncbi:MAG TPA: 30S ribosomal protein S6 [Candidatus Dojkabacteria bacterium]|jgi:small subunit ribosomal protein S6|nr:30S ribosomal protein S6 [Candidatus Dojkabacteria bacterium]